MSVTTRSNPQTPVHRRNPAMPLNSQSYKRNLILNIIYHLGPISRTEVINLTDYRPASVSAIIKELLDQQLLV